jgi:hypothetical protein
MFKGYKQTEEHKRNISNALRGELNPRWGKRPPNWKGGVTSKGYFYIRKPGHPKANKRGYVKRAILVLEAKLGRPIREGYLSHHINEDTMDDRPENLEERTRSWHIRHHLL